MTDHQDDELTPPITRRNLLRRSGIAIAVTAPLAVVSAPFMYMVATATREDNVKKKVEPDQRGPICAPDGSISGLPPVVPSVPVESSVGNYIAPVGTACLLTGLAVGSAATVALTNPTERRDFIRWARKKKDETAQAPSTSPER